MSGMLLRSVGIFMLKELVKSAVVGLAALGMGAANAAEITLAGPTDVELNELFDVSVSFANFPDFIGGGLQVVFDSDVVDFVGFTIAPGLTLSSAPTAAPGEDVTSDLLFTSPSTLSGEGPLGVFSFRAIAEGEADIGVVEAENAGNRFANFDIFQGVTTVADVAFSSIDVTVTDPNAVDGVVPVPAAAFLFAGGLALLRLRKRG